MAFTNALLKQTVFGNQRVLYYSCVADAATGVVETGLSNIDMIQYTPISMTTAAAKLRKNENTSGIAALGTVGVSGAVSGDEFYLTVYGR